MKPRYLIDSDELDLDMDALIGSAQQASVFLKALAHEARLLILCLLIEEEKSVTEIEEILSLRQPAISQQLARLRADGLCRRAGKVKTFSIHWLDPKFARLLARSTVLSASNRGRAGGPQGGLQSLTRQRARRWLNAASVPSLLSEALDSFQLDAFTARLTT